MGMPLISALRRRHRLLPRGGHLPISDRLPTTHTKIFLCACIMQHICVKKVRVLEPQRERERCGHVGTYVRSCKGKREKMYNGDPGKKWAAPNGPYLTDFDLAGLVKVLEPRLFIDSLVVGLPIIKSFIKIEYRCQTGVICCWQFRKKSVFFCHCPASITMMHVTRM